MADTRVVNDNGEEVSDVLPDTQPVDFLTQSQSQHSSQCNSQPLIWGQLIPIPLQTLSGRTLTYPLIKLTKDLYCAGREANCDICFAVDESLSFKYLKVISNAHFEITRESINSKNDKVIFLLDKSTNGTFVNRKLVGKGNKVVLDNNDVIALAKSNVAVYTFTSLQVYDPSGLANDLRKLYAPLRVLGSGACGEVKMVFSKLSHKTFAIKAIAKHPPSLNGHRHPLNDPKKIMNEVRILKALKNPFIIRMEDIVDTTRNLYIVLELMEGGELFDRIRNSSGLPEKQSKFIFFQIASAVNYLHSQGITHRDLKPENILLASDQDYPLVKVSDFGLSKLVDAQSMMKTFCGTPMYVAPEILKTGGRGTYTSQVDVWSLGVILYVTLSGYVPFSAANKEVHLNDQIMKGLYNFPSSKFAKVSQQAIALIKGMMTVDPTVRKTIRQVLVDPWLQDREMKGKVAELIRATRVDRMPLLPRERNTHIFDQPVPMKRPRLE